MKAPNKIHIHIGGLGLMVATHFPVNAPGEEEYIRKDALLEWARGMYEKTMTFVSGDIERDNEIQKFALRIVNHIESL